MKEIEGKRSPGEAYPAKGKDSLFSKDAPIISKTGLHERKMAWDLGGSVEQ